jgi:hypothetical protein
MKRILIILFVFCCVVGFSQPVLENYPVLEKTTELRAKLIGVAESQLHVREATGNNDGKEVERYLRATGLGKGYAWCAAYVAWCHEEVGIPNPLSAWSPAWFTSNVVYRRNQPRIGEYKTRGGEVMGLYYEHLKRVAHVGIITSEQRLHYLTIEGNTNGAGSREGDGVYRKIRRKESVYVIADYVGYREIKKAMEREREIARERKGEGACFDRLSNRKGE